jgi:hypothetical protein
MVTTLVLFSTAKPAALWSLFTQGDAGLLLDEEARETWRNGPIDEALAFQRLQPPAWSSF